MTTSASALLDEVLPQYDVAARYTIRIHATPERIYRILQEGIPIGNMTKILMALRSIPSAFRKKDPDCPSPSESFYRLKQLQDREIVLGIIGQFYKPVARPLPIGSLEEFLEFKREGYCKAVLNMQIIEKSGNQCVISTETRVLCFGSAKKRFKEYWKVIGPFSGLIRREMLRKIKKKAEA